MEAPVGDDGLVEKEGGEGTDLSCIPEAEPTGPDGLAAGDEI